MKKQVIVSCGLVTVPISSLLFKQLHSTLEGENEIERKYEINIKS